ncbi:MAG: choice-of-anchor I family protein [Acidobacteriota bacterium]
MDLERSVFTRLVGLGFKDHSLAANKLDASDWDSGINIANWPVFGMYQPDGLAAFQIQGVTYLVSANEGDTRDYSAYSEESRVRNLLLDPVSFPNAAVLQANSNLGRLTVTSANGDVDLDGDYDQLFVPGTRSFSVWSDTGQLLFDSGDQLEQLIASAIPAHFNANNDANDFDSRSDNKGPEPEGLCLGKAYGRPYLFLGLERVGGVVVYDLSEPTQPRLVQYLNNRDFSGDPEAGTAKDLGPEGLTFIHQSESPTHTPLLVVANEVSGTTTIFEIVKVK